MLWEDLYNKLKDKFSCEDLQKLQKGYIFAEQHHKGQKRASGHPYITHTIETANILFGWNCDVDTITAGILHDCIEDTEATYEQIAEKFGLDIAGLVEGVTKISSRVFSDSEEQKAENLRKMILAIVKDIRVILIKLADRWHNMRTLEFLPKAKRLKLARETMEIYAPLAHRMGMSQVKNELEDLSFRNLYPKEYVELLSQIDNFEEQRNYTLEEVKKFIDEILKVSKIKAKLNSRVKHLYSIWNKMNFQHKTLDRIYDIQALRVIVNTVQECYTVLGLVHAKWKPMPGRFKDYIAMPKSNLYQSLHTTVVTPAGEPIEIQIRTQDMHITAENGIAAHWSYKDQTKSKEKYIEKFAWLRDFLDWQQELRDSKEFMENLKVDLFEDEVFVFTPKGEVKAMPRGANPVDFAYLIHSDVGDKIIGAKVNGRMVPLKYELKDGEIVEVITRADAHPSRDWLKLAKTSKAKNRIRHYFRQLDRDTKITQGKQILEQELERLGSNWNELNKQGRLLEVSQKLNYKNIEELLLQVGDHNISLKSILAKLNLNLSTAEENQPIIKAPALEKNIKEEVRVAGLSGMVVRFAQCCHPIPGDPIIGYITQGRGVSIHQKKCPNLIKLLSESGRTVNVVWQELTSASHNLKLLILANEDEKLLTSILQVLNEAEVSLKESNTRITRKNLFEGIFKIQIKDNKHLQKVIQKIQQIKTVIKVERLEQK